MSNQSFLLSEFDELVAKIKEDTPAQWGIMTAHHLMEHLSLLFAISNGKLDAPSMYPPEKQAKANANFFDKKYPFPRNFDPAKTGKLQPLRTENMEEAKASLLMTRDKFLQYFGENTDATPMHPVMGPLDKEKWEEFHRRHISYHFEQFGLSKELLS